MSLHGFGPTLNEANFIAQRDNKNPAPAGQDYIRLEVFGRLNNSYRWCGETDVLEAMESVQARYTIDPERIVLRGFSMGGAGAWGMGLHHPDMWVAFEAGGSGAGGSASGFKKRSAVVPAGRGRPGLQHHRLDARRRQRPDGWLLRRGGHPFRRGQGQPRATRE